MKIALIALLFPLLAGLSFSASAQSVNIKGLEATENGTTVIKVEKGPNAGGAFDRPKWEVQDGESDVEGESGATNKDAKAAWTKACSDWKKEMREENKENKIVALNCGKSTCSGEAGSKVCTSKATYKIKTKVTE